MWNSHISPSLPQLCSDLKETKISSSRKPDWKVPSEPEAEGTRGTVQKAAVLESQATSSTDQKPLPFTPYKG